MALSTPFSEIYTIFLNDITDQRLVDLLTPEELGDVLEDYLMESAAVHFKECKKDLNDMDLEAKVFNSNLTHEEKVILSKGMKLKWLQSNFIANESRLVSRLTTKDYRIFSPANHLKILLEINNETKTEIRELIMSYLYDHLIYGGR
jgi:hypothetical protein